MAAVVCLITSRPHNDAGKPRSPRAAQQDENLGNPAWLSGSPQGRDRSPDEIGSIQTPAFSGQAGRTIYAERERVKVTRSCPRKGRTSSLDAARLRTPDRKGRR
jgi:hypothetical protein